MVAETEEALELSPFQRSIYWDDRRYIVGIGGRGSGKSYSICLKIQGMIDRNEIPDGARILVFGPNYPQLRMGTLKSFDKLFDDSGMVLKKIDGNEPERRLIHDIVVYFRNASNPDQTRSHEIALCWLDEAGQMEEEVFNLQNAALRQFGSQFNYQTFITTTPRGENWIYRRFKQSQMPEHMLGYYETSTVEAEKYGITRAGYVDELRMTYGEGTDMFRQEVLGQYVSWAGLVFNQTWKTPDPFLIPQLSRIAGGIDFGQIAPSVIKLIGEANDGSWWDFKEFYQPRCSFSLLLEQAVKFQAEAQKRGAFLGFAADSANPELIATLNAAGVRTVKSTKKPELATSYLNSLMERKMYFLSPDCHFTRSEYKNYAYKELLRGDESAFTDKIAINQADHAINANQYATLRLSTARQLTSGRWGEVTFGS